MLYIHTPFCSSKCHYCDFYSVALRGTHSGTVVDSMCEEIRSRSFEISTPLNSIYFGGGTPSLLSGGEIKQLLDSAAQNFDTTQLKEVTLESNTEQLSEHYLDGLLELGVNRLSIGVQSFDDERLAFIGRRHTARGAIDAISRARRAGFGNISIDLMFGFAEQTLPQWQSDIETVLGLGVEHISAYQLSIEPGTIFARRGVTTATQEQCEALYLEMHNRLTTTGYEHYEISNFALNGFHSQHNSGYWDSRPYVGIGPSAHSFDGAHTRSWNISNIRDYIAGAEAQRETLSQIDIHNEFLMIRLRTAKGFSRSQYRELFGRPFETVEGVEIEGDRAFIAPENLFISDSIISSLFIVNRED